MDIEEMPEGGLEPPRAYAHMVLNHARLPIPPLRRMCYRHKDHTVVNDTSVRETVKPHW